MRSPEKVSALEGRGRFDDLMPVSVAHDKPKEQPMYVPRLLSQSYSQTNDEREERQDDGEKNQQEYVSLHAEIPFVRRHGIVKLLLECGPGSMICSVDIVGSSTRMLPFWHLYLLVRKGLRVCLTSHRSPEC